ncbi:MAG: tRNA-dihydrouridine synthase family protein [Lentisphaerae bacterium]|nr:tRNA-dihydrouridine synthase family protein [Lentisphaerota bacterium]
MSSGQSLPCRILPGPMHGVTEGSFLRAMSSRGWVQCWWTPFLRISTAVPRPSRLRNWLKPYLDTGLPVIAQIMGCSSAKLAAAAQALHAIGCLCVDLNCSCPSATVIGNGSGGARLQEPPWIRDTLLAMRASCPGKAISVKIRAGFSSPEELPGILAAVRAGAPDFVTLHYRCVSEMYKPVPEGWRRLKLARELLPELPLLGSGDLFTTADALRMRQQCGVDALAPARGLLANPALLLHIRQGCLGKEAPPLSKLEKLRFLRDLAEPQPASASAPNGFLLRFCAALLGPDSRCFQELLKRPRLQECHLYLQEQSEL